MIKQVIRQMMISRQQTQMRSYFETANSPILVVTDPTDRRERSI